MLPHALSLPATGDFWWPTVVERYALYCLPYPPVGWLVAPGGLPTSCAVSDPKSESATTSTVNGHTVTMTSSDYAGFDVSLTIIPARDATPCIDVGEALLDSVGGVFDSHEITCQRESDGRWQYGSGPFEDLTQIERVGGYFIALTVNFQAEGLEAHFNALFAGLHHPDDAGLVAIGLSHALPSPVG